MNFIFIGGTYRGKKVIESLLKNDKIPDYIFILKEDDHETKKYSEDIKSIANTNNIPFKIKKKLSKEDENIFQEKKRDFAIICGWRTIINFDLNKYFKLGLLAAHDSLLPKYRGFAPINWAIINGESKTGVTLFQINNGEVDSGKIIDKEEINILHDENAVEVYEKITVATIKLINNFLKNYINSSYTLKEQNHENATYTCKRIPNDGLINWNKSSTEIYNLIRALSPPYPCAYTKYKKEKLFVRRAQIGDYNERNYIGRIVGRVINIDEFGVEILCGRGTIKLTECEFNNRIVKPNEIIKSIKITF